MVSFVVPLRRESEDSLIRQGMQIKCRGLLQKMTGSKEEEETSVSSLESTHKS